MIKIATFPWLAEGLRKRLGPMAGAGAISYPEKCLSRVRLALALGKRNELRMISYALT